MRAPIADSDTEETYAFIYGNDRVPYRVKRKATDHGKPRKVSIQVTPDSRVIVEAPEDAKENDIHDAVMKRAKWIYNNLQAITAQQRHIQPRRYVSGEMQFYLGRRYVLKVVTHADNPPHVKMERGKLLVSLPQRNDDVTDQVRKLLKQWYRARAQHIFAMRLEKLLPEARWIDETPNFRILSMDKQWGSCSKQGTLMLNPHLVKAPRECIDYVILHELCHIREHNHSERFYRLLTQQMPGWRQTKQRLDDMAELLLNE